MFSKPFNSQPTNFHNNFFNVCTDIKKMCGQSPRCSLGVQIQFSLVDSHNNLRLSTSALAGDPDPYPCVFWALNLTPKSGDEENTSSSGIKLQG